MQQNEKFIKKLYDNLEVENEDNMGRIQVLERRVEIMKKDRGRLEHHIDILSKEKERLHSQVKNLESGKQIKKHVSNMKKRENNWSNSCNTSNNDLVDSFKFQKASLINVKGTGRSNNYAVLANPNLTRKMNLLLKQLHTEKERSKDLVKSNQDKDIQISDLRNRLRNMARYS